MYRPAHQSGPAGRNSGDSSDGSTWTHPKIPGNNSITAVSDCRASQNPEIADRRSKGYLSVQANGKRCPGKERDELVLGPYRSSGVFVQDSQNKNCTTIPH